MYNFVFGMVLQYVDQIGIKYEVNGKMIHREVTPSHISDMIMMLLLLGQMLSTAC